MGGTRVVVLGAGIVGSACARELALAGCTVTVVDRGGPAAATTSHSEGNVLVSDKSPGPELRLAQLSRRLWPEILADVVTAGAAQALAKGERVAVGDRMVVAGSGPFLLPVAASLLEAGSRVLEVLEANTSGTVARGWSRRPSQPAGLLGRAGELAGYTWTLGRERVPYRFGRTVIEARGEGRVEEVVTARLRPDWSVVPGSERVRPADALCVGHGFSPQLELPLAAGCALRGPGAGPSPDPPSGGQGA
ncbi:FAD-dependent oxidoreductase [Streptomyces axinellae]|uniref:FAD-dependent oxidoreductase n=1 Tax=Streptomyces axinellae TaxID=552788 RepID=UPI0031DEA49F